MKLNLISEKQIKPSKFYLWKYLEFYKALSFFETQTLIFSPLNKFKDPFEGANRELASELVTYIELVRKDQAQIKSEYTKGNINNIRNIIETLKFSQKQFYTCCFFESNSESEAMWKMYANDYGIAIRFNATELFDKFKKEYDSISFKDCRFFYGSMDYTKIKTHDLNVLMKMDFKKKNIEFNPFLKDLSYSCEEEYRFIFRCSHISEDYIMIGDVKDVNYEIFIPSNIENWQREQLEQLLKRYGINKKVQISSTISRDTLENLILL